MFPLAFMPEEMRERYDRYLATRYPANMFSRSIDVLNYGIQSFSVSGFGYDVVRVTDRKHPYSRMYRPSASPEAGMTKQLVITSRLCSGFLNWLMFSELYQFYYDSPDHKCLPCSPMITILDSTGVETIEIDLKNLQFTNISALDFNFSSNAIDFKTFTCTFEAQEGEMRLAL